MNIWSTLKRTFVLFAGLLISFECMSSQKNENETASLGFSEMEVFRFNHGIHLLKIQDLNGDGLDDILFLNTKESRVEVLLRRKSIDEKESDHLKKAFVNNGFVIEEDAKDLLIADMNSDGKADIITVGPPYGVRVRTQKKDGTFSAPANIYPGRNKRFIDAETADLDKDGSPELLLCRKNNIEILKKSKDGKAKNYTIVSTINFSYGNCTAFWYADFTGDSKGDLLFLFGKDKLPLCLLKGDGKGHFSWEYPMESPHCFSINKLKKTSDSKYGIGMILKRNVFRTYNVDEEQDKKLSDIKEAFPQRLFLKGLSGKIKPAWAVSDLNSDGFSDLCVAAPALSQIHIYYGNSDGFASKPFVFDSVSGISKLAVDSNKNIIVFSPSEKIVARHINGDFNSFPQVTEFDDTPLAFQIFENNIYVICNNSKTKKKQLFCFELKNGIKKVNKDNSTVFDADLKYNPSDMKIYHLDNKTKGIVFFIPYEKPELFALGENGKLKKLKSSRISALTVSTLPSRIFPLKKNTGNKLLICDKKLVREYSWNGANYEITGQLNPAKNNSDIAGICKYYYNDGKKEIFLYDRMTNDIVIFADDKSKDPLRINLNGNFQNYLGMEQFSMGKKKGLLILTGNTAAVLYPPFSRYTLSLDREYSSDTEKVSFFAFETMSSSNGRQNVTALFDQDNRGFEFIEDVDGRLKKIFSMEVFKCLDGRNPRSIGEPRELQCGDINGDGIKDFITLVHDRIIIYFGE